MKKIIYLLGLLIFSLSVTAQKAAFTPIGQPGQIVTNDPVNAGVFGSQSVIIHTPVQYATTAALAANTYNNGTSGIGATLTANSNGVMANVDGQTPTVGDRILVKNEVTTANNGIYTVTQVGSVSLPYILTRGAYSSLGTNMTAGTLVYVQRGTANANLIYYQTTTGTVTIGTTALVWTAVQNSTSGTAANVQVFSTPGTFTWTKPSGAQIIEVTVIAGGGGGGSGYVGAAATARVAGGGGGSGAYAFQKFLASNIASTVSVVVGSAGTGGAASSGTNVNGNNGTSGTLSSFGTFLACTPGGFGSGGRLASYGYGGGQGVTNQNWGSLGNAGNSADVAGGNGYYGDGNGSASTGAGSGGGITTGDVVGAHGNGGTYSGPFTNPTFQFANPTTNGGNGITITGTYFGTGGNGGDASKTANATAGGSGAGYGAGGGGGGAALNGFSSGAGGNGTQGIVVVVSYF